MQNMQKDQLYKVSPISNELLLDCALKQNIPLNYKSSEKVLATVISFRSDMSSSEAINFL
jgi:hypothetical protein